MEILAYLILGICMVYGLPLGILELRRREKIKSKEEDEKMWKTREDSRKIIDHRGVVQIWDDGMQILSDGVLSDYVIRSISTGQFIVSDRYYFVHPDGAEVSGSRLQATLNRGLSYPRSIALDGTLSPYKVW